MSCAVGNETAREKRRAPPETNLTMAGMLTTVAGWPSPGAHHERSTERGGVVAKNMRGSPDPGFLRKRFSAYYTRPAGHIRRYLKQESENPEFGVGLTLSIKLIAYVSRIRFENVQTS